VDEEWQIEGNSIKTNAKAVFFTTINQTKHGNKYQTMQII